MLRGARRQWASDSPAPSASGARCSSGMYASTARWSARSGRERDAARQLGLERVKEGFGVRVVARARARWRSACSPRCATNAQNAAPMYSVPAIAVKDQAAGRAPSLQRSVEDGAASRAPVRRRRERPREHAPRILIHHDGEIAPAARRQRRYVMSPTHTWSGAGRRACPRRDSDAGRTAQRIPALAR